MNIFAKPQPEGETHLEVMERLIVEHDLENKTDEWLSDYMDTNPYGELRGAIVLMQHRRTPKSFDFSMFDSETGEAKRTA